MERYFGLNLGLLILRIMLGGSVLMHGIAKIYNGIDGVKKVLVTNHIPEFIAYGVYIGEILAPLMIIFGIFARSGAFLLIGTTFLILYVAYGGSPFATLPKTGGFMAEILYLYLGGAFCIMLAGSGKYAVIKD